MSEKGEFAGSFARRHLGPRQADVQKMLEFLDFSELEDFVAAVLPKQIVCQEKMQLDDFAQAQSEVEALELLRSYAEKNQLNRSLIGAGYSDCISPPVILRNILENPGWYTQYTPYQAEIAQGRLAALLNFQTMISDLCALPVANASLLDEATAAAEAMALSYAASKRKYKERDSFFVADSCHPQTLAVVQTRGEALGIRVVVGAFDEAAANQQIFGALFQYPDTNGGVVDYRQSIAELKAREVMVTLACDLLSLCLLTAPGELGADIAVGNSQRFGVPLGYGGPHAAFFAVREEFRRQIPGRIVGISRDADGKPALRLALQTREQHIRREKATSNICTAQVLLAIISGFYAVYHGCDGLRGIAEKLNLLTRQLAAGLESCGVRLQHSEFFDTLCAVVDPQKQAEILARANAAGINLREYTDGRLGIALDQRSDRAEIVKLLEIFGAEQPELAVDVASSIPSSLQRSSAYLQADVFKRYHSETEFLRYLKRLESRDLSLGVSMIPLGSCTMKLNATSEMLPVSWPEFSGLHPFVPLEQAAGYQQMFAELERGLCQITGFSAVSLQPNAGSQGEFAGLLVIRAYHQARGDRQRNVCLIPKSAHGTNPASAVMAGMRVVVVDCDPQGNIDLDDLRQKAEQHAAELSALMVTYPSTHGVFEESIREICSVVHQHGGQVYMDGANLNAMVGLVKPAELGADVCHFNLHKTFCIPHGGGGPGMGPIGVVADLAPFLPGHPLVNCGGENSCGSISAAPWGSPSILPISWMYIRMMGADDLRLASEVAILNANYIARRLAEYYPVLYRGSSGFVAHECILDFRQFRKSSGVEVEDVAKRLMDYGFHAPTISWPVAGTMMIEPTESESLEEMDRFCDALIAIRAEIAEIESGKAEQQSNLLKNAPHTAESLVGDWDYPYSRERACYPATWTRDYKFWPAVRRIDSAYGDRHLICTCPATEDYLEA